MHANIYILWQKSQILNLDFDAHLSIIHQMASPQVNNVIKGASFLAEFLTRMMKQETKHFVPFVVCRLLSVTH